MGGESKKPTIGYKYYLGMHMAICHGPIDKVIQITVDKREAYRGSVQEGTINIDKEDLFGGDTQEGGVSGALDLLSGKSTQTQNAYLQSQLGQDIPAFRGIASVVLNQMYLAMNPYLKPWAFRTTRVHTKSDGGVQWYDGKAEILTQGGITEQLGPESTGWKFTELAPLATVPSNYMDEDYDDSSWATGQTPFGTNSHPYAADVGFPPTPNTSWSLNSKILLRHKFNLKTNKGFSLTVFADNYIEVWVNEELILPRSGRIGPTTGEDFLYEINIPSTTLKPGENLLAALAEDEGSYSYVAFRLASDDLDQADMNPAHIIRECLTDKNWGMGYPETDIDDASFTAAADVLYDEEMGISLLWDKQIRIEEFIEEIKRHINAVIYIDPVSGKFVLKLIREDYDVNTLLELNSTNCFIKDYTRSESANLVNSVTVGYWDAGRGENSSITVDDIALMQASGRVINTTVQYPGFTNSGIASLVAGRELRTLSSPLLSCTLEANREASQLKIGDVFKLVWPDYHDGYVVMRVTQLSMGDGKRNTIKIICTEDIFGVPEVSLIGSEDTGWDTINQPAVPVTTQIAYELPYYEMVQSKSQPTIDGILENDLTVGYFGMAAGRPNSTTLNARLLTDSGAGYKEVAELDFCPTASLVTAIGRNDSALSITDLEDIELIELGTWCQIDDELLRVDSITANSLTVARGVLDTIPEKHAADSLIYFWDGFSTFEDKQYVDGEVITGKLVTKSTGGVLDPDLANPLATTMDGRMYRPYPPGKFQINGALLPDYIEGQINCTWTHRDRTQQTGDILVPYNGSNIGPEAGVTYDISFRDHTSTIVRNVTGLSGGSYNFTTELTDAPFYAAGNAFAHYVNFSGGIPGGLGTFFKQSGLPSAAFDASSQAMILNHATASEAYYLLDTFSKAYDFAFSFDVELMEDYGTDKEFGMWLLDDLSSGAAGYKIFHNESALYPWNIKKTSSIYAPGDVEVPITGNDVNPLIAPFIRRRLRLEFTAATGVFTFKIDGEVVFTAKDTSFKNLQPAIFIRNCKLRVFEIRAEGRESDYIYNSMINVRLQSVRNSKGSYQRIFYDVYRVGYGYSYGHYYGGL